MPGQNNYNRYMRFHHKYQRGLCSKTREVSLQLTPPIDRNIDPETGDNSADQLLRKMGGFVPFFASQEQPPPPSEPTKKDESKGGFWGVGDWFRRDNENKTNDNATAKKRDLKASKKNPKVEAITTNRNIETETSSPLTKLQDLFSFNSTKSPDEKEKSKSLRSNNSTNNNPLSVFQKLFTTPALFKSPPPPEETWYPVFPKTRIMPGQTVPVSVAGIDLLVIASIDGRSLYCIANSCPHLGTPLETGRLTRLPIETKSVSAPPKPKAIPSQSQSDSILLSASDASEVAVLSNKGMGPNDSNSEIIFSETDIANILSQDGCEDCIVCPLHHTAFALSSGEVRGEWCPYPPVIGAIMGTVKAPTSAAVFQVRTRGKNIEVLLNSVLRE